MNNTSTASLVSSSSSSSSSSDKNDDTPHSSSSLKLSASRLRIRKPRIHIHWPRKSTSFVRLPKDEKQLDARPIHFRTDIDTDADADADIDGHVDVNVDANTASIQPLTPRHLKNKETEVRAREAKVGKREDDVRVREKKVWEGLQEVARGKVHVAVLEARVRELEGAVGSGKRWGRKGSDMSAGCEGRERGTRQWWVKGWWSFSE